MVSVLDVEDLCSPMKCHVFSEVHSVTTQKSILFVGTAVRTSNPMKYWAS
jgi:hypothetical protein